MESTELVFVSFLLLVGLSTLLRGLARASESRLQRIKFYNKRTAFLLHRTPCTTRLTGQDNAVLGRRTRGGMMSITPIYLYKQRDYEEDGMDWGYIIFRRWDFDNPGRSPSSQERRCCLSTTFLCIEEQ